MIIGRDARAVSKYGTLETVMSSATLWPIAATKRERQDSEQGCKGPESTRKYSDEKSEARMGYQI